MKSSKKPNKIFQDSSSKSHPFSDKLPEYSMSQGEVPKIHCLYHKDQLITNFCGATQCLMPLCPECVKIHTEDHSKQGTYGKFETIDEVWMSTNSKIRECEESFLKTKQQLTLFQNNNENLKSYLVNDLRESRKKLLNMIEEYYDKLENAVVGLTQNQTKDSSISFNFTHNKINERLEELQKFEKKLKGKKFLKYVIIFQSTDFLKENINYNNEIENYLVLIKNQMLRVNDILDSQKLFGFLGNYICLENVNTFQEYQLPQASTLFKEKPTINQQPIYLPQNQNPSNIYQYTDVSSPFINQSPHPIQINQTPQNYIPPNPLSNINYNIPQNLNYNHLQNIQNLNQNPIAIHQNPALYQNPNISFNPHLNPNLNNHVGIRLSPKKRIVDNINLPTNNGMSPLKINSPSHLFRNENSFIHTPGQNNILNNSSPQNLFGKPQEGGIYQQPIFYSNSPNMMQRSPDGLNPNWEKSFRTLYNQPIRNSPSMNKLEFK